VQELFVNTITLIKKVYSAQLIGWAVLF